MSEKIKKREINRLNRLWLIENLILDKGYNFIAGVDESGRGPLAGPVVAAACILPKGFLLSGLDDCKKVEEKARVEIYNMLVSNKDVIYSVGVVDSKIIDQINILQASLLAMKQAIMNLPRSPDYLIFDGNQYPMTSLPSQAIIDGDSLCISIAAASIIAKVTRDKMMLEYHEKWPVYDFASHKGYGTKEHKAAILTHGICDIHRRSFDPIKSMISKKLPNNRCLKI